LSRAIASNKFWYGRRGLGTNKTNLVPNKCRLNCSILFFSGHLCCLHFCGLDLWRFWLLCLLCFFVLAHIWILLWA
jgi:hypothetical protein